ncbi:MAG: hypothetical protein GC149_15655 [Gammaproteobacteria bacterium]|nr:hypothetical protein [Gammaproteobacteria bacterium]
MNDDGQNKQAGSAAESPSATAEGTRKASAGSYPSLELTKVILEFLGKTFYPVIIIVILVLLWPAISGIDFSRLFGNIKSAKVGGVELTFDQAQDIGAEIAPLNSKVAQLERDLKTMTASMARLQTATNVPKASQQETKELAAKEMAFKANSAYTILVFHRAESRERAALLTKNLLADGYQSSDTETNFSELKKVKPEDNVVFLTYTSAGKEILTDLQKRIAAIAPQAEVRVNPRAIDLKRGDVQILVF